MGIKEFVLATPGATAADIGRGYAPDSVKDKAGWGRKMVTKMLNTGVLFRRPDGSLGALTVAQELLHAILSDCGPIDPHQYKAPHAPRGTPPRPHYSRYRRTPRLFRP